MSWRRRASSRSRMRLADEPMSDALAAAPGCATSRLLVLGDEVSSRLTVLRMIRDPRFRTPGVVVGSLGSGGLPPAASVVPDTASGLGDAPDGDPVPEATSTACGEPLMCEPATRSDTVYRPGVVGMAATARCARSPGLTRSTVTRQSDEASRMREPRPCGTDAMRTCKSPALAKGTGVLDAPLISTTTSNASPTRSVLEETPGPVATHRDATAAPTVAASTDFFLCLFLARGEIACMGEGGASRWPDVEPPNMLRILSRINRGVTSSGSCPRAFLTWREAPRFTSSRATLTWPPEQARWSGVDPFASAALRSTSDEAASRDTTATCPWAAAACRGVMQSSPVAATRMLASSSVMEVAAESKAAAASADPW
mmetsp:Transcript_13343/g.42043  ORF Transcript_13343/g.42043 Transcript_13343/m.42043 type:complete len:371 (+) Transcript_13343:275-1387(+)